MRIHVLLLCVLYGGFGCSGGHTNDYPEERDASEFAISRAERRVILRPGETSAVEHTFAISHKPGFSNSYTLESKSCGCLNYLPESITVSPEKTELLVLRGTLTGVTNPQFSGYNAVYRSHGDDRLHYFHLDTWAAPPLELEQTGTCDGRIVWRTLKQEQTRASVESIVRVFSLTQESLSHCEISLFDGGTEIECHPSFEDAIPDERHGFWVRRCRLRFTCENSNLERVGTYSLRLCSLTNQGHQEIPLTLKLRDSVKVIPASVFFRSGVAAARNVVVRSDEPIEHATITATPIGVTCRISRLNESALRIEFSYDGSPQDTLTTDVELHVSGTDPRVMQLQVYFLQDQVALPRNLQGDNDAVGDTERNR